MSQTSLPIQICVPKPEENARTSSYPNSSIPQRALAGHCHCGMLDGGMWLVNHVGTPTLTTSAERKYRRHLRLHYHYDSRSSSCAVDERVVERMWTADNSSGPVYLHLLVCELEVRKRAG